MGQKEVYARIKKHEFEDWLELVMKNISKSRGVLIVIVALMVVFITACGPEAPVEAGDTGSEHDQILAEFHAAKEDCQAAYDEALRIFHEAKDAVSDGDDHDAQVAALEVQKDAAEAEKDACIASAEAEKDAALETLEEGEEAPNAGETGAEHDQILADFHTAKDACQAAFDEALCAFHEAKDAIPEGDDRDAQMAVLEAQKDAAEAVKDACIAAAEAEKDAALEALEETGN